MSLLLLYFLPTAQARPKPKKGEDQKEVDNLRKDCDDLRERAEEFQQRQEDYTVLDDQIHADEASNKDEDYGGEE